MMTIGIINLVLIAALFAEQVIHDAMTNDNWP